MQKREIHAMEDLKPHENIVTLHRVVESGEWLLLVMEFCAVGKYFTNCLHFFKLIDFRIVNFRFIRSNHA
jgi:serine/threonine protein kinase